MKKILFYVLIVTCLLLCVSLVACGNKSSNTDTNTDTNTDVNTDSNNSAEDNRVPDLSHTHSFRNWETVRESTCSVAGEKKRVCECGHSETEALQFKEHTYDGRFCSVCGEGKGSEGIEYMLSYDESYYIVYKAGQCTDKEVYIPNQYNGKPVKRIEEMAFFQCHTMESLVIAEGVEVVSAYAFGACVNLKSVKIPNSVKTIEEIAFLGCRSLETISIGNGLERICKQAFVGCVALKTIFIPTSVTYVENNAFEACNELTIHCEHSSEQAWGENWNGGRDVVWGQQ